MVVKAFMTLSSLTMIDAMFVKILPKDLIANWEDVNKHKILVMGPDNNTYPKLWIRVKNEIHRSLHKEYKVYEDVDE